MSERQVVAALPTCSIGLRTDPAGHIVEVIFLPPGTPTSVSAEKPIIRSFNLQLAEYLADPRYCFSLPLAPRGTPFQMRVRQAICRIPAGEIRYYSELARDLGSSARAIGQACGANPFPLIIPCHRVLAKTGLGGFAHAQAGWLIETKRWLLRHEGSPR